MEETDIWCSVDASVMLWMWEHTSDHYTGLVGANGGLGDYRKQVSGVFEKNLYGKGRWRSKSG